MTKATTKSNGNENGNGAVREENLKLAKPTDISKLIELAKRNDRKEFSTTLSWLLRAAHHQGVNRGRISGARNSHTEPVESDFQPGLARALKSEHLRGSNGRKGLSEDASAR